MAPQPDMNLDWKSQNVIKKDGQWTVDGRPNVQIDLAWNESPANNPGMAYIGLKVTAPVNAATAPHKHGGAAVAATMVKGQMLNQMICPDGHVVGPKLYNAGDSWYEPPGCHHVRSENTGDEEAVFTAAFVIDEKPVQELGLVAALLQFGADQQA